MRRSESVALSSCISSDQRALFSASDGTLGAQWHAGGTYTTAQQISHGWTAGHERQKPVAGRGSDATLTSSGRPAIPRLRTGRRPTGITAANRQIAGNGPHNPFTFSMQLRPDGLPASRRPATDRGSSNSAPISRGSRRRLHERLRHWNPWQWKPRSGQGCSAGARAHQPSAARLRPARRCDSREKPPQEEGLGVRDARGERREGVFGPPLRVSGRFYRSLATGSSLAFRVS